MPNTNIYIFFRRSRESVSILSFEKVSDSSQHMTKSNILEYIIQSFKLYIYQRSNNRRFSVSPQYLNVTASPTHLYAHRICRTQCAQMLTHKIICFLEKPKTWQHNRTGTTVMRNDRLLTRLTASHVIQSALVRGEFTRFARNSATDMLDARMCKPLVLLAACTVICECAPYRCVCIGSNYVARLRSSP